MRALRLLLLSSIASAAPLAAPAAEHDKYPIQRGLDCKVAKTLITLFHEQAKATAFCSQYLSISATTTTVTAYATAYDTSTVTGASTSTSVTADPTTVYNTATVTATSEAVTATTVITSSNGITTTNIGLVTCGSPGSLFAKRNALPTVVERAPQPDTTPQATLEKRILATARPATTKPACWGGYKEKDVISSACKCLSLQPTTSTVTNTQTIHETRTVTVPGTTSTCTVTPTVTATSTITTTVAGTTTTVTSYTSVAATTVTAAQGVATPSTFYIYTFSNTGASSVTYANTRAAAASAASQLQRVIFAATSSGTPYTFNGTATYVYDVVAGKALVALNSTTNGTNNTNSSNNSPSPNPPGCNGTNATTTNSTNCNGNSTNTTPTPSGSDYGVKLDKYPGGGGKESPLTCSVVPVVIGKGFGCKLVCSAFGSRVVNQLGPNGEWILDKALDQGDTAFQPFIAQA